MTLFLSARAGAPTPGSVVIQGAPWDDGVSYRKGAAGAPEDIRLASDSIESWSPRMERDLEDVTVFDVGDLTLNGLDPVVAIKTIAEATEAHARAGAKVVTFGGDHSVSIGTSRGLGAVYPGLVHVVYDAHMDMRPEYDGSDLSHACGTRHMSAAGDTFVLGVRSGCREEWVDARTMLRHFGEALDATAIREQVGDRPLFISVDLDVLDPGVLPGTGTPEPGGATYKELRESLLTFAGCDIVGIDFVEVAPSLDPSGISPVTAASITRECILGLLT